MWEDKKISSTGIVSVSNSLVYASYSLSLVEKRLLVLFISQINNDISKVEGKEKDNLQVLSPTTAYFVSVKEYADLYDIEYETAKDELRVAVDRLYEGGVNYTDDNGTIISARWLSSKAQYDANHRIRLKWGTDLIPLISELRSNFLSYKIRLLSTLSSTYAIRFYEIFLSELNKAHKSYIERTLTIDELRAMFLLQNKYLVFSDFRKRVIEDSISQINKDKNTNIIVSITGKGNKKLYNKEGRNVVSVTFRINRKPQTLKGFM